MMMTTVRLRLLLGDSGPWRRSVNMDDVNRLLIGLCLVALVGCATPEPGDEASSATELVVASSTSQSASTAAPSSTVDTSTTSTASESASAVDTPEPDLVTLARAIGASVVVARDEDSVFALDAGVQTTIPIPKQAGAWSDGEFVYLSASGEDRTMLSTALTLDGIQVCDAEGPIHHATRRTDGTYVMAVELDYWLRETDGGGTYDVPIEAVDCQTGERQPIEPVTSYGNETETRIVIRVGGREFIGHGDVEGNADMVNERGISINGDDYAGYHTFNTDASQVVYGDMGQGAGPHYSQIVTARNTATGDLRWSAELPTPFVFLAHLDDHVIAGIPEDMESLIGGDSTIAEVVLLAADTGELLGQTEAGIHRLLYVGP